MLHLYVVTITDARGTVEERRVEAFTASDAVTQVNLSVSGDWPTRRATKIVPVPDMGECQL